MQANDFENKIKSQLDEFTLVPKEAVWDLVAARIAKEKKRRGMIFWFLFPSIIAIGLLIWGIVDHNGKKTMVASSPDLMIAHDPKPNATARLMPTDKKIEQPFEKLPEEPENKKSEIIQSIRNEKIAGSIGNKKSNYIRQKRHSFLGINDDIHSQIKAMVIHEKINDVAKIENKQDKFEVAQESEFLPSKQQTSMTSEPKDSSSNANPVKKEPLKKQALSMEVAEKKNEKISLPRKGWNIGITAFAGFSNNQPGISLGGKNELNYSAQVNTTGGLSSTFPDIKYSASFSFGVGVFAVKQLSDKIGFSIGGDYHFYQANSKVGSKFNGILNVVDPMLLNQSIVTEYYSFGNTIQFANKYHLIEMPLQLSYRLNKQKESPVTITTSLIPGYLIWSAALYSNPNSNSNAYYVEKKQFNQFQLSAALGLMFTIKNKFRNRLSIGPVFQYNLTNMTKGMLQSDQHLLFGGIKTNLNLK